MTDSANLAGDLSTHRHTARQSVTFSAVTLTFDRQTGWQGGTCHLASTDGGAGTSLPCPTLSALSAEGAPFPVTIICDGQTHGPYMAEGIVTRFPQGADCYLFRRDEDGLWDGVAVTLIYRGVAIVPYACDPT